MFDLHYESPARVVHEIVVEPRKTDDWNIPLRTLAKKQLAKMKSDELDRNWKLNDFFGNIIVINLPQATERKEQITKELQQIGTKDFKFFPAIYGRTSVDQEIWQKFFKNRDKIDVSTSEGQLALDRVHQGEAGCYMSHYTAVKQAKDAFDNAKKEFAAAEAAQDKLAISNAKKKLRKYSRVLIFEDDVGFGIANKQRTATSKKGAGKLFRKALAQLPDDWDMLYFVVHAMDPTKKQASHLRKLKSSWYFGAYAINHKMYDSYISTLSKIENPAITKLQSVDLEISLTHHKHKVYAIYPSVVYSYPSPSHISTLRYNNLWQGQPLAPGQKP